MTTQSMPVVSVPDTTLPMEILYTQNEKMREKRWQRFWVNPWQVRVIAEWRIWSESLRFQGTPRAFFQQNSKFTVSRDFYPSPFVSKLTFMAPDWHFDLFSKTASISRRYFCRNYVFFNPRCHWNREVICILTVKFVSGLNIHLLLSIFKCSFQTCIYCVYTVCIYAYL